MNLPKAAVLEYQQIYKTKCKVALSFEEAERKAVNFLKLMALITTKSKNENEKTQYPIKNL